jgi:hypothetical protein
VGKDSREGLGTDERINSASLCFGMENKGPRPWENKFVIINHAFHDIVKVCFEENT